MTTHPTRPVIGSLGELLVEFICTEQGGHHASPAAYIGPFPSGAPGIFIDQAARIASDLGGATVFSGSVGNDAFGRVLLNRLRGAGVSDSLLRTIPGIPTGSAFVSYNPDGSRDFVFNIAHSAAAHFPHGPEASTAFLAAGTCVLHISGSMLGDPAMRARALALCQTLHRAGVEISLDPNIRPELLRDAGYLDSVRAILGLASYILPSDADAEHLFPGQSFAQFGPPLLAAGARFVALKRGADGAIAMDRSGTYDAKAHPVDVIDPTGAGDCFCATFVTLLAAGRTLPEALRLANAAGALAVSKLGPMEGNSSLPALFSFLKD